MLTKKDYLLVLIMEECAEVAHRAAKALRFGLTEVQNGQVEDNAERLMHEIIDLDTVIEYLVESGDLKVPEDYPSRKADKILKIERYMRLSRNEGRLEAEVQP
jgi:hypothetical protein